ncbi:hypothetical protein PR048_020717 [Dryococelus australis]|uniref:Uncharacterized protein n=1 Tax=Dryococelus australis TaxID=614101 RepID=A0ABQ9H748_9NEOP|nr:hypothetical protein PR048_020717 [Dryococelus australis]
MPQLLVNHSYIFLQDGYPAFSHHETCIYRRPAANAVATKVTGPHTDIRKRIAAVVTRSVLMRVRRELD